MENMKSKWKWELEGISFMTAVILYTGLFIIIGFDGFAQHVRATEIFFSRGFGDHHGVGFIQCRMGITGNGGKGKHVEESGIHMGHMFFNDKDIVFFNRACFRLKHRSGYTVRWTDYL